MPTKKPRIQALVEQEIYEKFQKLCKTENRSESNFSGKIITEFIRKYEQEHGEIQIEKPTE